MLVNGSPVNPDDECITVVALIGRHDLAAAAAVKMVIPKAKQVHTLANGLLTGEWTTLEVRLILGSPEDRFGVKLPVGTMAWTRI